jgi:beta-glucosidase
MTAAGDEDSAFDDRRSAASVSFPEGFLWGAATASHQVEGGNRWNDWWEYEQRGLLPYRSGDACRHYELYESDFDLARSLSHNAQRISLEWSRIEPAEGQWNPEAVAHYRRVIASMRARGLEPLVTLHHFTNPAWFTRSGGWVRGDSVKLFRRYADYVADQLCDQVRLWVTVNEPTVFIKHAYVGGDWPPCMPKSWFKAAKALRNLCRAHVAAYEALHRRRSDVMVGFAHSAPYVRPCRSARIADRLVARLRDFVLNDLCFLLMARSPRRVLDFIGINYYARQIIAWQPRGAAWLFGSECRADHHGTERSFSSLGWEIYAPGLKAVLRKFGKYGRPIIVTENGIATSDEELRVAFLTAHVAALAEALSAGIDVRGYFYWTLMDNYEWTAGFTAKFGLAAVDFETQQRLPRPIASSFKSICEGTINLSQAAAPDPNGSPVKSGIQSTEPD